MNSLVLTIYLLCADNIKCHDYMVNCSVSKNSEIKQEIIEKCVKEYEEGKRYEEK